MKKDRLFLDANILFSAAYSKNSGLLQLWKLKTVKLFSSLYAIEEARRNLDATQKVRLDKLLLKIDICPSFFEEELPEKRLKQKIALFFSRRLQSKQTTSLQETKGILGNFTGKTLRA